MTVTLHFPVDGDDDPTMTFRTYPTPCKGDLIAMHMAHAPLRGTFRVTGVAWNAFDDFGYPKVYLEMA